MTNIETISEALDIVKNLNHEEQNKKNNKNEIKESGTSRSYNHIVNDENFAIISPYRSENSLGQNKSNLISLKREVRNLGYGFNELIARWVEFDENLGKNISSDERSLFIHGMQKNQAIKLGKKYEQSSIIVKDKNGCREICTTPFNYEEDGKVIEFNYGDIVRKYNISGNSVLNIKDAEEIFSGKKDGPSSKPVKSNRPFKLNIDEDLILEVWEVEQPRASYFNNGIERYKKIF